MTTFKLAAFAAFAALATTVACAGHPTTTTTTTAANRGGEPRPAAAMPAASPAPASGKVLINKNQDGVALQGYDPVAYFTDGHPVLGVADHQSRYGGAVYWFASTEHQAAFDAEPARFAPQYGGYCGYAASINRLSPIDPPFCQILDGRLVLQHTQKAFDLFNQDLPANLVNADHNWPGLIAKNGKPAKVLVNLTADGVALHGYDPVAYFTDNRPVQGSSDEASVFNGAIYWFASHEHRVTFENDPTHYEPQFGGFCAYAASIDKISPIDPTIFQILDGRLLLQHTPKALELFNQDPHASLGRADHNWPGLIERPGQ